MIAFIRLLIDYDFKGKVPSNRTTGNNTQNERKYLS